MTSIIYSEFDARLAKHRSPDLAMGFVTYPEQAWDDPSPRQEVLWALMPNGEVYCSNPLKRSQPHFFLKGRAWTKMAVIPENAEFIGQYRPID